MRTRRRLIVGVFTAGLVLAIWSAPAGAHPLGNFTTNTYAGLRVEDEQVTVDYVIDLAEIPTLQASPRVDTDGDDDVSPAENAAYRQAECLAVAGRLSLQAGESALAFEVMSSRLDFPPGQGSLDTLRLECELLATAPEGTEGEIRFADANFDGRLGWREVTAVGDGTTLVASDVPSESVSDRLVSYPEDRLQSPLDQRSATLDISPEGPVLDRSLAGDGGSAAQPRGADRFTQAFTDLVSERAVTPLFAVFAFGLAMVLGTLHAIAPGHGKTLMAAYVVGKQGTIRQLSTIGLTVAITHTGGVLALGLLVSVSETFAPARFVEWATVVSGVLLAAVGVTLVLRRGHGHNHHGHGHDHDHGHHHGHDHEHNDHEHLPELAMAMAGAPAAAPARPLSVPASHDHHHGGPGTQERATSAPRSLRSVVAMGFAGGLVPSPSALIVLLGATALGRVWFGVLLVLAYGLGMALTLVTAGFLLLRLKDRLDRWALERPWFATATRVLPFVTAAVLVIGGLSLAGRAYVTM